MTRQPVLNPDSICPPELRAEAAEVAAEIEAAINPFRELCVRGAAMKVQLHDVGKPAVSEMAAGDDYAVDGAWRIIDSITGYTPIDGALRALDQIAGFAGDRDAPEQVERSGRGLSDWQVEGKEGPARSVFEGMRLSEARELRDAATARIAELENRGEVSP